MNLYKVLYCGLKCVNYMGLIGVNNIKFGDSHGRVREQPWPNENTCWKVQVCPRLTNKKLKGDVNNNERDIQLGEIWP